MVHQTLPTVGEDAPPDTDEQFLAVLCAEEELMRAEFDAIIAAEWPIPPPPHRVLAVRAEDDEPPSRDQRGTPDEHPWGRLNRPGIRRWARQRSPPPPAAPNRTPTPIPTSEGEVMPLVMHDSTHHSTQGRS